MTILKQKILPLRKIFLKNKSKVSQIEFTADNYDDSGKLIKHDLPTITTDFAEIGAFNRCIYFTVIIESKDFNKKFFNQIIEFNPQIYKFFNFNTNLYPKKNFDYKKFIKEIKQEKYLQIQFNFDLNQPSELIFKKHQQLKQIFKKNKIKVINQLDVDLTNIVTI